MYGVSDEAGWHDVCSSRVGAQAGGRIARCASGGRDWPTNGWLGQMSGVDGWAVAADTLVIPERLAQPGSIGRCPEAIMQAKPKSNSVVTHTLSDDKCVITFTVKDAEGPGRPGRFSFDVTGAHADMQHMAAVHGFIQRISDGAAMSRDRETGKPATPAEKMARMQAIADHYASGVNQWGMNRAAGGEGRGQGPSIVVRALAALQGLSVADALARVREQAEKQRTTTKLYLKKLATAKTIIDKVAELRAAEASADGDEMLAELLGETGDEEEKGAGPNEADAEEGEEE